MSKRGYYIILALVVALFILGFLAAPSAVFRQGLVYFLLLAGLFLGYRIPVAILATNLSGLVVLVLGGASWPVITGGMAVMLVGTAFIPYYFRSVRRRQRGGFRDRHESMTELYDTLQLQLADLERERKTLENDIDRINQLYILGRELVEHLDLTEVVEHLSRVLLNRPGVKAVAMFSREKSGWLPLHFSRPDTAERWGDFMAADRSLTSERRIRILVTPEWAGKHAVVFWPVRLEEELLAAILLITEVEDAPRYLEEGVIFIPQIALGLRRTRLFAAVSERSRNDGLTGLYLRRYFLERLQTEVKRGRRYSSPFSVMMIDIDFFKRINDTYGHLTGDTVLCGVARQLVDCVRPGDLVGRYGGEEFIVLLPLIPPDEAMRIAAGMNRLVAAREYEADGTSFRATVSIGVACYPGDGATAESLIDAADRALYWVKAQGRNGVRRAGDHE